jgi:hypothetical protein
MSTNKSKYKALFLKNTLSSTTHANINNYIFNPKTTKNNQISLKIKPDSFIKRPSLRRNSKKTTTRNTELNQSEIKMFNELNDYKEKVISYQKNTCEINDKTERIDYKND